ncbi:hypothetical protein IAT38_006077 [Cryptococcus sp. DSM 104549]
MVRTYGRPAKAATRVVAPSAPAARVPKGKPGPKPKPKASVAGDEGKASHVQAVTAVSAVLKEIKTSKNAPAKTAAKAGKSVSVIVGAGKRGVKKVAGGVKLHVVGLKKVGVGRVGGRSVVKGKAEAKAGTRGKATRGAKMVVKPIRGAAAKPVASKAAKPAAPVSESEAPAAVKEKREKKEEKEKRVTKPYLSSGFYCANESPAPSQTLVARILAQQASKPPTTAKGSKAGNSKPAPRPSRAKATPAAARSPYAPDPTHRHYDRAHAGREVVPLSSKRLTFPPLPFYYGQEMFFEEETEFVLPWNILVEKERGLLDGKKKPAGFQKIRSNVFPERARIASDIKAICKCAPSSGCGDTCINRIMSYLCGKDCPCGDACTNKALNKRKGPAYKVAYAGARGFGIVLQEDVQEGDFVMDYRGEVISLDTFMDRIYSDYKGQKNFYALEYDQCEVIDAGMRGNDARFINHGCAPNLEVRKYQTLGDGWEEYEVGMWALRDIKKGEELFYDYNFECFGAAAQPDELRTKCCCGAPNCVGFLGRKAGEKSAKEIAVELAAKRAEAERKEAQRLKRARKMGVAVPKADREIGAGKGGKTPSLASSGSSAGDVELGTPLPSTSSAPSSSFASLPSITHKRKSHPSLTEAALPEPEASKKPRVSAARLARVEMAELAKKAKEEQKKARNGAPMGWAYVSPAAERKQRAQVGSAVAVGGRRAPRDRSGL